MDLAVLAIRHMNFTQGKHIQSKAIQFPRLNLSPTNGAEVRKTGQQSEWTLQTKELKTRGSQVFGIGARHDRTQEQRKERRKHV